ncbi:MAG: insulinase family protein [Dysgonamonadaceae bacterium]|jgi:zinc protease|nr:insulinase family protein [Dysgonamonadaceae bacterium]
MKKLLFLLGFVLAPLFYAFAQQAQPLPIDSKVRYGKLENGLTYYIRHNELPKQRADFYIAQNVGSILEEDNQRGLAHFLEHMAFNGSTHFSGNQVISYLETIGVKFGVNLNAYTSFDRTVYNISNVPAIRTGTIDSCLLILHDWSNSLSLEESDILKERGVIREEMRSRGEAQFRMMEKLFPQIMPGNKYGNRMPIGIEEVVMNFKPEELREYYRKWYRPDLQGIIIVGDIDVDQIENKLKEVFADIPAPVNPAERTYTTIEDNVETLVGIVTDKESTRTSVSIDFKHEKLAKELRGTVSGLVTDYLNTAISRIMSERISEITQKANPPFINAGVYNDEFAATITKESLSGTVIIKGNDIESGMKALVREIARLKKYGFTEAEYDRARTNILTQYESAFKEKDKVQNIRYANEYVSHFTSGGYIPGIEAEYNMISSIAPNIPVDVLNQYVSQMIGDKNIVISLQAAEKEGETLPAKADLLEWFNEAINAAVEAPKEEKNNEPLLAEIPSGGKITSMTENKTFGTTILTLSNGVKVVIKPTTFKDDEILLSASSPGGSSHFPESENVNIQLYNSLANIGGLGQFSQTDLRKALAGKQVSLSSSVSLTHEGFTGSSSVKDFETMLQLIYLNFTAPRVDEDAYQSFISRVKSQLESQEANPEIALSDTLIEALYINTLRNKRLKSDDLDKANYQTILDWRKDRFADASDFTFVFTGNINIEATKDLIEKYLGTLPNKKRKESIAPVNLALHAGINKHPFQQKMENLKASVVDAYWTTIDPTLKNRIEMDMLQQILNIVYTEKVREEEGGTYGVSVSGSISNYPKGQTILSISFETQAGKETFLNDIIQKEFREIANQGPRPEDFNKVKEFMLKRQQEQEQLNSYWSSVISNYYRYNYNAYSDYVKTLQSVTPADVKKKAKKIIDGGNLIEVIMTGVKE